MKCRVDVVAVVLALVLPVVVSLPSADCDSQGIPYGCFAPEDIISRDVCIIGGGSSGTYAAIQLHDAGKTVVVVEKQDHLGGHVNTYTDSATGGVINLGVQVFHNTSTVTNYFHRLGVTLVPSLTPPSSNVYLDFDSGKPVPGFTPASAAVVGQALEKWSAILAANYSYLEAGYFLPDPVPEELLMTFSDFAVQFGVQPMASLINEITQNDGEVWKQTTLYMIKEFSLALVQALTEGFVTTHDVSNLYTSAASVLGSNVLFSSTVASMDRNCGSGLVCVVVTTPNGRKLIQAKKLIMASPPLLENLRGWDLSAAEATILGKFSGLGYYAGVLQNKGIPGNTSLVNIGTHNPFNLNSQPGCFQVGSIPFPAQYTVYYGSAHNHSDHEVQTSIVRQLDRLSANGNFPAADTSFLYWTNHFPYRVFTSANEIRDGFYKKLYALQGTHNTYWTGAAWTAQDSSLIWSFTASLLANITI